MNTITKKITHLLTTTALAVVLQFSSGISPEGLTSSAQAETNQADVRRMFSQGYGYCDAKKVAGAWNISVFEAKAVIGRKIRERKQNLILRDIKNSGVFCNWSEVEVTYADAEKLGGYWGVSTNKAKSKAKVLINERGKKGFRNMILQNSGPSLSN